MSISRSKSPGSSNKSRRRLIQIKANETPCSVARRAGPLRADGAVARLCALRDAGHTFQDFVDSGCLPPERAKNCGEEYQQIKFAFEKTILPFVDQEQMAKVRERQWFQPAELQELPHSNHCRFVTISGRSGVIKCVAEG